MQLSARISIHFFTILMLASTIPRLAFAQSAKETVSGNVYLTNSPSDDGWECERGYVAQSAACLALQVPVNGHIDYYGHDWKCNPPYNKQQKMCVLPKAND
jgi:hypothetical protein